MASRFARWKESLERLVFAGLKPDVPTGPKKSKIEALMQSAEDLASRGLKPEEKGLPGPVTWRKRVAVIVGILVICGALYLLATVLQKPAEQAEKIGPPPALIEIVPKGLKIDKNKDLEVVEMEFDKNKEPKEIVGTVRNLTDREFAKCEISFDVTTRQGAQLGGAGTTVKDLPAHGTARFRIAVPYPTAGFVMVRDLRPE